MSKTALVIRATGSQGKAVVKHLAKSGWQVHALVSDPDSERALALKEFDEGISLYQGSLSDATAVEAAINGCDAVFLTQIPSNNDPASETREASILLDLARAESVKHIAISTQLALNDPNVEEIFSNPSILFAVSGKVAVEKLVRGSGIPWTAIRPGWFNTNVTLPLCQFMYPGLSEGKFTSSYTPDVIIPTVDPDDIGAFTTMVFNHPEKFTGRSVSVVSENLTVTEMLSEIERACGKKLKIHYRIAEENEKEKSNLVVAAQLVMKHLGALADMDEIKSYGIPLTSFRQFLENNKDEVVPKKEHA